MRSKVSRVTTILLVGTLVFLGVTWWMNGRDDTWLYAACASVVLASLIPILLEKNEKDQ